VEPKYAKIISKTVNYGGNMQMSFFEVRWRFSDAWEILNKIYFSAMLCSSARGHLQIVVSKIKAMMSTTN